MADYCLHQVPRPENVTADFARALWCIIDIPIIKAKIDFHLLDPFDLIKTIGNKYIFPGKYALSPALLRR